MKRSFGGSTAFLVGAAITSLAGAARADVEIRPAPFLSEASRQTASQLRATNAQAAAAYTAVRNEANGVLGSTPRPLAVLHYEGVLETDPRRIETQDRLRDMDKLALVVQAYVGEPRADYAAFIKSFVWAWGTTYVPTGNPINENKLEAVFAGYYATKAQFTTSERSTLESWLNNIATRENQATSADNWETKRFKIIAQVGLAAARSDWLDNAVNRFRAFVPKALRSDGSSNDFHTRDALGYHQGALNPLLGFCLLAEQNQIRINGQNLYEWQASNGGSVKKSVHFLDPYVLGTETHMEFQNSTVPFDAERCAAGIQEYCPHIWQPSVGSTDELYAMASGFEPSLSAMSARVRNSPNTEYPMWLAVTSRASVNLAPPSGGPVVHSYSSQEAGNEASNLIDGDNSDNTGARWSANNMPQWVILDYGSTKSFVRSRVWTYQDRAYRYNIEASSAPTSGFTRIVDRTSNTSATQPITNDFAAVSARYIRITVTGASGYTGTWASLTELEMVEGGTPPQPTTVSDVPTANGWGRADAPTTAQSGPLQVRSDATAANQRKAWLRFNLSNDGVNYASLQGATLELTAADQPSNTSARTLHVYGIQSAGWPTGSHPNVTWNNGPGNLTSSAWGFSNATLLGTATIAGEGINTKVTINLSQPGALDFFKNDSDKVVVLGFSFGTTINAASFKFVETGTNQPVIRLTY